MIDIDFQVECHNARRINKAGCEQYNIEWPVYDSKNREDKMMNAKEELFAKLFNNGKQLVSGMSLLEMRAKREELSKIAFEARAILTGVQSEIDDAERQGKPSQGFQRSINTDDITSNAINTINERKQKLSKDEKMKQGLMKSLGLSEEAATRIMSAGAILAQTRKSGSSSPANSTDIPSPGISFNEHQDNKESANVEQAVSDIITIESVKPVQAKLFVSPFDKKE